MKKLIITFAMALGLAAWAENPRVDVMEPLNLERYSGQFVLAVQNFHFQPELAGPVEVFGNGLNLNGDPIQMNSGHLHGWIFKLERSGKGRPKFAMVREDSDFPTPNEYVRFYGAGGWDFVPMGEGQALIIREDGMEDLADGLYQAFFALQFDDHTALMQSTAPAMQPVASVVFEVKNGASWKDKVKAKVKRKLREKFGRR